MDVVVVVAVLVADTTYLLMGEVAVIIEARVMVTTVVVIGVDAVMVVAEAARHEHAVLEDAGSASRLARLDAVLDRDMMNGCCTSRWLSRSEKAVSSCA